MAQATHSTRRSLFVGAAALSLASGSAVALVSPDAELIRACDTALDAWAESDSRGADENWSAGRIAQNVEVVLSGTERASSLRANTHVGLQAKARLLARHFGPDLAEQDAVERLLGSLLRDLIGQGVQA